MEPYSQDLEQIQGRLLKLEEQNRRLKQLGAAALIVAASLLVMGQAPSKKTVEANEFILNDDKGNVRARLRMGLTAPQLELVDEKGTARVRLRGGYSLVGGPVNFSGISLFDEHGRERGTFDADENGAEIMVSGPVTVSEEQGFQATLGTTDLVTPRSGETHKTSAASLVLFDKSKNVIWKAP
jgi:hypothetical protein